MIKLFDYEAAALAAFSLRYFDQSARDRLALELPEVYNKLMGRRAIAAVRLCISCERMPGFCACGDEKFHAEASVTSGSLALASKKG